MIDGGCTVYDMHYVYVPTIGRHSSTCWSVRSLFWRRRIAAIKLAAGPPADDDDAEVPGVLFPSKKRKKTRKTAFSSLFWLSVSDQNKWLKFRKSNNTHYRIIQSLSLSSAQISVVQINLILLPCFVCSPIQIALYRKNNPLTIVGLRN